MKKASIPLLIFFIVVGLSMIPGPRPMWSEHGQGIETPDSPLKSLKSHEKKSGITGTGGTGKVQLDLNFGKFPLYFISNKGQVNKKAIFYARASRYTLWLTQKGLVFESTRNSKMKEHPPLPHSPHSTHSPKLERDVTRLIFLKANTNPEILPLEEAKLKVNYFIGNDKSKWVGDIPTSQAVLYKNLYKNIDLQVYGIEKQIEYDWIVKPGADPGAIRFEYKNVKGTRLDEAGNLVIETNFGELIHKRPDCYQQVGNARYTIPGKFRRITKNTYGFSVGKYDTQKTLIIDPVVLAYSTYLGGSDMDYGESIAVDGSGNAYVTGHTSSTDFPTLNQYQGYPGDADTNLFVTRLDTTQSGASCLIYSTYLGGSGYDRGYGIAVDNNQNAYITGFTTSTNFPVHNQYRGESGERDDVFVVRLDTNLSGVSSLIYSTYMGGGAGQGIALDGAGYVFITGYTFSNNFPTLNQFQGNQGDGDAFVSRLDTDQAGTASLLYSTYLGGSNYDEAFDIAIDSMGHAYVTGRTSSTNFPLLNQYQGNYQGGNQDVFVTRLDTEQSGSSCLVYSTYLGGTSDDEAFGIAVNNNGHAFVAGRTGSTNFPIYHQFQGDPGDNSLDVFVTRLNTNQSGTASLVYSTYLGGNGSDQGYCIALGAGGNVYLAGYTDSTNFPILNQFQENMDHYDGFVTRLDTDQSGSSSLIYSAYLGGCGHDSCADIAVDAGGNVYVTGMTNTFDLPLLNQYQGYPKDYLINAFITKFAPFPAGMPGVTTIPASSITTTSATGGGIVTFDGGDEVTARGVCWSLSANPTLEDDHTIDGSGTGEFQSQLTGLTPNTGYFVRAYATNSVGTAYGNDEYFETEEITITVTSPNGGEAWVVGTAHTITWTHIYAGNVKIEYSTDNGDTWTTIAASTENDGSYPWTVPSTPSSLCLVRITQIGYNSGDISDSVFTIAVSANAIPLGERQALIALYNSTGGYQWLNNSNWKKPDDTFNDPGTEYTWYGIIVQNNHVTSISLGYNDLQGTLPVEIGNFPNLSVLEISSDPDIPSWIHEPVSGTIPASIVNLGQLTYMDFSGNDFDGNIPDAIFNLSNLTGLNLNDCEFSGGIPSDIGNLTKLQYFACKNNHLSGTIPDILTTLSNLRDLDLSYNDLEGSIPTQIGSLTQLRGLSLQHNALTGPIPSSIGNFPQLDDHLLLQGNKLSGSIPTSMTNLIWLVEIDIRYNALYTNDAALIFFLNGRNSYWKETQTIAPANVSALALSKDSIRLTWTPIIYTGDEGGYRVFYGTSEGGPYTFFGMTVDKSVPSKIVTGLTPGTRYYFVVQTRTLASPHNSNIVDSQYSNEVSAVTYSYSLTLTSPNGGESWDAGSSQMITWTSQGTINNVLLEYSSDGGNSWYRITDSTTNDGNYNWYVPTTSSAQCLVRIKANEQDGSPSDTSDAVFSIISQETGTITLRSPNGGESWGAGTTQEIRWNSTGDINNVTIEYSTDNGSSWTTITNNTANDHSYDWLVPETASTKCLVRVSANDGDKDPKPSDTSNSVFSIVISTTPSLKIRKPNGDEELTVGSKYTISWSSVNTRENVILQYSVNTGESWTNIVNSTENDGEYRWTVPDTPSVNCLVRIMETDGQPSDTSNAVFSIVTPPAGDITVTSPNGGESWTAGTTQEITWTGNGNIDTVTIDYSADDGNTWNTINKSTPNDGSYNWTLPETTSEDCLVRISSNDATGDPIPSDTSDAVFSIVPPPTPTLRLKSPNGGEQWEEGTKHGITWKVANSRDEIKLEYSLNAGETWTTIVETTENDGSYQWTIPGTPSETCLVRVSEINSHLVDISDAVFSILSKQTGDLTVEAPNGGESWIVGSTHAIEWSSEGGIDTVSISYSTDDGKTWDTVVSSTANSGTYNWIIPDAVSAECLVRVQSADDDVDPKPSDVSDQVFSITSESTAEFKVTFPNGGETWEVDTVHAVTWIASGEITNVAIDYSTDNGETWDTVVSSTANSGTYNWKIPNAVSSECLVRISANDGEADPKPSDMSDAVFSIRRPAEPVVRVITPNGGEQLVIGTKTKITWYGTGSREQVKIEYSANAGETWTEITSSTENDGEYDWTVPDAASTACLVRISETDGQPVDVSDAVFSIVEPQSGDLTLLTPNGGETLATGTEYEITWTCSGLDDIIIEYSIDNGETWLYIDRVAADNGSYTWTVPGTSSDLCLVRISGAEGDEGSSDTSDAIFTIN